MNSKQLNEKVIAAKEKITKIENTLAKHEVAAQKKKAAIEAKGYSFDRYDYTGNSNSEAYWMICEYDDKLEAIKETNKKLADAKVVAANWVSKLANAKAFENKLTTELPEIFRTCKEELANEWTTSDLKAKECMLNKKKELDYKEFRAMYKYTQEQDLMRTEKEFRNKNLIDAETFIIDLYDRVKAITGEVTDWANIHYAGKALNGTVKGTNGIAKVETILAGGYNIQRLHMRVLVKEV